MRIASLISAGTEMLFVLGLDEYVVAVSHECDWPPACRQLPRVTRTNINDSADSQDIDGQVRALLAAGKPLYEVDAEQLAELEPDLIVTQAQCDVCAIRYDDVLAALQRTPTLRSAQVFTLNPQTLDDVLQDITRLGAIAGITERANEVVAALRGRIENVRKQTLAIAASDRPRVAMIEWLDPLMLAGNWTPELLELTGGQCRLTPRGEPSRYHPWEEIREFNPQVIVVCPCGFDVARTRDEARSLAQLPGWTELAAVQSGRLFVVDGNAYFNRPGPRLVESVERLAALLQAEEDGNALSDGFERLP